MKSVNDEVLRIHDVSLGSFESINSDETCVACEGKERAIREMLLFAQINLQKLVGIN